MLCDGDVTMVMLLMGSEQCAVISWRGTVVCDVMIMFLCVGVLKCMIQRRLSLCAVLSTPVSDSVSLHLYLYPCSVLLDVTILAVTGTVSPS